METDCQHYSLVSAVVIPALATEGHFSLGLLVIIIAVHGSLDENRFCKEREVSSFSMRCSKPELKADGALVTES